MRLSRPAQYAVGIMHYLSSQPAGKVVQIGQISDHILISEPSLRKITCRLARMGLIYSFRGKDGGIMLASRPEAVSLLDVVEAIEGKILPSPAPAGPRHPDQTAHSAVDIIWQQLQKNLADVFGTITFADLGKGNPAPKGEWL